MAPKTGSHRGPYGSLPAPHNYPLTCPKALLSLVWAGSLDLGWVLVNSLYGCVTGAEPYEALNPQPQERGLGIGRNTLTIPKETASFEFPDHDYITNYHYYANTLTLTIAIFAIDPETQKPWKNPVKALAFNTTEKKVLES